MINEEYYIIILIAIITIIPLWMFLYYIKISRTKSQLTKEFKNINKTNTMKNKDSSIFNMKNNEILSFSDRSIILKTDKDNKIFYVDDYVMDFFGKQKKDIMGRPLVGTLVDKNPSNEQRISNLINIIERDEKSVLLNELTYTTEDEQIRTILWKTSASLSSYGNFIGYTYVGYDVTIKNKIHRKIHIMETRDPLTGVLNRDEFISRFEHNFKLNKRYNKHFSLMRIDVCKLVETINEKHGYLHGDKLLKEIGQICLDKTSNNDYAGRIKSTIFSIFLSDKDDFDIQEIAKDIFDRINKILPKFELDKKDRVFTIAYVKRRQQDEVYENMRQRIRKVIAKNKDALGIFSGADIDNNNITPNPINAIKTPEFEDNLEFKDDIDI